MNWQILVDSVASKFLKRIPRLDAKRILDVLQELVVNPYAGDIEKMEGKDDIWRRRVGSYRILYEIYSAKRIIYISDIRRRTSKTY